MRPFFILLVILSSTILQQADAGRPVTVKRGVLRKRLQDEESQSDAHIPTTKGYTTPTRKLECRYRKSCYSTGIMEPLAQPLESPSIDRDSEQEEWDLGADYSEGQLKLLCKYRTSCYTKRGINNTKNAKRKPATSLVSKSNPVLSGPARTVQDVAKATIRQLESKDRHAMQHPPVRESAGQLLFDAKAALLTKNSCKYRKSCYASGKLPRVERLKLLPAWLAWDGDMTDVARLLGLSGPESSVPFAELESAEKRVYCKYRKSCYNTGVVPKVDEEAVLSMESVMPTHKVVQPVELLGIRADQQLRCRYRKSCYETGALPSKFIKADTGVQGEEGMVDGGHKKQGPVPTSIEELRLYCKYRRSCYTNQAHREGPNVEAILLKKKESKLSSANGTNTRMITEDSKRPVVGNPHPKVPVAQRRKEKKDRLAQALPSTPTARPRMTKEGRQGKVAKSAKETGAAPEKRRSRKLPDRRVTSKEVKSGQEEQANSEKPIERAGETGKLEKKVHEKQPIAVSSTVGANNNTDRGGAASQPESAGETLRVAAPTQAPTMEMKLECRYRKSCYASKPIISGEMDRVETIPLLPTQLQASSPARSTSPIGIAQGPLTTSQKLQCKYRTSCYPAVEPVLRVSEAAQRSTITALQHTESIRAKHSGGKEIAAASQMPIALKLECKYRHSCYMLASPSQEQFTGPKTGAIPSDRAAASPPASAPQQCNKYWISCQKLLGLPVREKAPMGPNGKKLCRRKRGAEGTL